MPKVNKANRPFVMSLVAYLLGGLLHILFRVQVIGKEKLPKTGAYILVFNHVTHLDPLAVAYATFFGLKRGPHFLAKGALFKVPVLGQILTAAGQVLSGLALLILSDEERRYHSRLDPLIDLSGG